LAHFIADWGLQSDFVATNKGKYSIIMFAHCFIWTGVIAIALQYLGILSTWKIIFLFVGHWVMDIHKCNNICDTCCVGESEKHNMELLYLDQIWHLIQCLIVYYY